MKTHLSLALLVLSAVASAKAERISSPILCPVEQQHLVVENPAKTSQPFWYQALGTLPFLEKGYEIPASSTQVFALSTDYESASTAFAIKSPGNQLKFTAICKDTSLSWKPETQTSPWKSLRLPGSATKVSLHLVNLSPVKNEVSIDFGGGHPATSLTLPGEFTKTSLDLEIPAGVRYLKIHARGRWSGKVFTSAQKEIPLKEEVQILASVPPARYFLFRSPSSQESYVVPMQNQKLIDQSLDQIAHPETKRLLVGRIDTSPDGTNRDLVSAAKSPWSWAMTEAQNYADFAHISCDGSPSVVEERLGDWIQNNGATVCFWSYRIEREVLPEEITRGVAKP
jgi:hypothetical protein